MTAIIRGTSTGPVRVGAAQYATGTDVQANLAKAVEFVEGAAAEGVQLLVLPEFANHPSWYRDAAHAHEVAVDIDGSWIRGLAAAAAANGIWVKVNVTLRRTDETRTGTNILIDDTGRIVASNDKQVLMGSERAHLSGATKTGPVVATPFGPVGMYACMDGVINETPRDLAVRGAWVLLNSLNSFALDEGSLHIPVRGPENRVWIVAANKVGSLVLPDQLEVVAKQLGIEPDQLHGSGESQIVAPWGEVVAIAPTEGEALVIADIDPSAAANKVRPSGTDVFAARRPEIYKPITSRSPGAGAPTSTELKVAAAGSVDDLPEAASAGARICVLPELSISEPNELVDALTGTGMIGIASFLDPSGTINGVVASAEGVVMIQPSLHPSARHPSAVAFADEIGVVNLGFCRLAVIVGEDMVIPETARLAAIAQADVIAWPGFVVEDWETATGYRERAAENRVCLIASTADGRGAIVDLPQDLTLWQDRTQPFNRTINDPVVTPQSGPVTVATIHPARAANRQVSRDTDLVEGRPWALVTAISAPRI